MSTFDELTSEVISNLGSWTRSQELATALSEDIDASQLNIPVVQATTLAAGVVEIGNELMHVDEFDTDAGTLTVSAYGRGYDGSTAATHSTGDRVTFNPRFTRQAVRRELNKVIRSLAGELHGVGTVNIEASSAQYTYEAPQNMIRVLRIEWQSPGTAQTWIPVRRYNWNLDADPTAFPSGKSIDVFDPIQPGQTIRVVYAKDPTALTNVDDDFASTTGLSESCEDVIVYGAAHRLLAFLDAARLDVSSVSEDYLDDPTPVGSAASLSRYFFQLYQNRLSEEKVKLDRRHQPRLRWAR